MCWHPAAARLQATTKLCKVTGCSLDTGPGVLISKLLGCLFIRRVPALEVATMLASGQKLLAADGDPNQPVVRAENMVQIGARAAKGKTG